MDRDRPAAAGQNAQKIAREPGGEDVGREARHYVVSAIAHRHDRHDEPDRRSADERQTDAGERVAAGPGPHGRAKGAREHHAFEPDREDASALRQDSAKPRKEQRRRDADRGCEEVDHARRTVAASTNSMVSPSMTATSAEGTPICLCIESEPASASRTLHRPPRGANDPPREAKTRTACARARGTGLRRRRARSGTRHVRRVP